MLYPLRAYCPMRNAGKQLQYIHVFCDFWADQVHVLWLNTHLPAWVISQPASAPHPQQVQPAPARKAVRVNPPRAGL